MTQSPPGLGKAAGIIAAIATVALVAAGAYFFWPRNDAPLAVASTPLPPLSTSPFLNTKLDVGYVGDAACADCHQDVSRVYRQHAMGRSMFAVADNPAIENYDRSAQNPFQAGRFHFKVERRGADLVHTEWCEDATGKVVARKDETITHTVGSGTQARSYLCGHDGFLSQSPITWYADKSQWGLAPGFENTQRHFTRKVDSRCLYCHSQDSRPVEHTANKYRDPAFGQLAIGCERCHGPGELHVARRTTGPKLEGMDDSIVNPRHLSPALRDNVCEQCHLQGETIVVRRGRTQSQFRPGLPLHEYMSVFVRPPDATDATKIVSHVEQMRLSECSVKSAGKFGCTSCHDPHRAPAPAEKTAFYREKCVACHGAPQRSPGCSIPVAERAMKAPGDNCIACHMPRSASSNAGHLAITDHRVLRRPNAPRQANTDPVGADIPLMAFHRHLHGPGDDEVRNRDLGIALIEIAVTAEGSLRDQLCRRARPLLEQATKFAPDDVPALEAQGFALSIGGEHAEALKPLAVALNLTPEREAALTYANVAADRAGQLELAETYARKATELYPGDSEHHQRLAAIYLRREKWPLALLSAQTAVKVDPFSPQARGVLIAVYFAIKDPARARAEFTALGVIDPAHRDQMRAWFDERVRRAE